MNLFSRFRSALGALFPFTTKSGMAPADWLRAADIEAEGGAQLLSPYAQSAWVYIAVSVLAETVAQVPFRIARLPGTAQKDLNHGSRGLYGAEGRRKSLRRILGENIVETGAVVELFENPHPMMDRALFWETLMTWRALRGEFFILPLDENDRPVEISQPSEKSSPSPLTPLPQERGTARAARRIRRIITLSPDLFWHMVSGYELHGWRYTGSPLMSPLASQVLLPGEVIHSRAPNPYQFWRGMSPLSVALLPAMSDYAAAQFMKGLMLNNADSGLIITSKEQLSPEQRLEAHAALTERKRKAGTADRPLFLFGGVTIQKPPVSSADLQFLENRKLNRQEIGAIFKVPESLMGFSDTKHSIGGASSIEQERMAFIENTIAAHCRRLEAAVQPIVKSFGQDLIGYFDLDCLPLLQQARRERLEAASEAFAMGVPFNEINAVYDLGFSPLPWGDTGHLPAKLQEAGRLTNEDSPSQLGQETESEENPFERLAKLIESRSSRRQEALTDFPNQKSEPPDVGCYEVKGNKPSTISSSECHAMVGTRSTASVTSPEKVGRRGTRPYPQFEESVRLLTSRLQKFFFEQRCRLLTRLSSAPPDLSIDSIWNSVEEDAALENRFKLSLDPESHRPEQREHLLGVNQRTLELLSDALRAGTASGESVAVLAGRIKAVFRHAHDIRAEEIAAFLTCETRGHWESRSMNPQISSSSSSFSSSSSKSETGIEDENENEDEKEDEREQRENNTTIK